MRESLTCVLHGEKIFHLRNCFMCRFHFFSDLTLYRRRHWLFNVWRCSVDAGVNEFTDCYRHRTNVSNKFIIVFFCFPIETPWGPHPRLFSATPIEAFFILLTPTGASPSPSSPASFYSAKLRPPRPTIAACALSCMFRAIILASRTSLGQEGLPVFFVLARM